MTTTASGRTLYYSDESFNKSPQELLGQEKIEKWTKEHGEIKGFTKVKVYKCSNWVNECDCGYDEFKKDTDFQFCPCCREQLYFENSYPELTAYSEKTAKSKEEAIKLFCEDGTNPDDVTCSERISVHAYYVEVPKLGDGYKA